jgi:hypothetical protein
MSSEKKVLIVSKEQGLKDLGDLVLQFNTDIASRIPDDYSELYDAIVLYSVPENISELFSNYEIPVIATDNLAEQIEKQGYSALASICPREMQIGCLQALLKRKDSVKAPWKRIQTNFKIKYGDLDSRLAAMVREGIPKYEAFFAFIEQNTENLDGIINEPMIPFTRVHAELVKNLELCERFKGGPNEAYFYAEALENLKEYLDHARKRREHLTTMLKLTGPSIGGGSHYLYVDLKEASKEQPEFSFLKHVLDKEKIPHQVIADIIYHDAKHFGNKDSPIRFAASMPPIQYENASYLVRDGIIGPDLEDIFLLIRRRIAKGDHNKVPWLRSFRDAATQQVMKDIAYWQKNAPQISAAEIPQNPDGIVEHLQRPLKQSKGTLMQAHQT